MRFALNETGGDTCRVCIDGWVELDGTVTAHGVQYTRGSAPCKYCETGKRRYTRAITRGERPDMMYDLEDVIGFVGGDVTPAMGEARGRYIEHARGVLLRAVDAEASSHGAHRRTDA